MDLTASNILENGVKSNLDCFEQKLDENQQLVCRCNIKDCGREYNSKTAAIRHIRLNHRDVHDKIKENKTPHALLQQDLMDSSIEIRVKVVPSEIIEACVEMITVNALPLCAVEFPAFRKILNPYIVALNLKGINLVINKETIKDHINQAAAKIMETIRLEVRNKLVCLMIDIASRYNRSVLGTNIAYMSEGEICIRTIGMQTLKFSTTSKCIVENIKERLNQCGIDLEQIEAVTSDNGSNMIRSTALLEESYRKESMSTEKNAEVHPYVNNDDDDDDEYIDEDLFDDSYYDDLLEEVRSAFGAADYTHLIHGISCAAHSIQLVIKNAIKRSPSIESVLQKCRELAKKLRTPSIRSLLQSEGFNMALLEVETRWGSMFSMVCFYVILMTSFQFRPI